MTIYNDNIASGSRYNKKFYTVDCLTVCRLQFVFKSSLISALDLIDRNNVMLLKSPSGRQVFRVSQSNT